MNQKGVSPIHIVVLVLVVGIVAFYAGTKSQPVQHSGEDKASKSTILTQLVERITGKAEVPVASIAPTLKAALTPTASTLVPDPNMIVSTGDFHFSQNVIKYTFIFPKNGGPVTGHFEGVCNGTPTGNFSGGEGGKIEGIFEGKCTAGPMDLINVPVKATYNGIVHLNEGKIDVSYHATSPIQEGGFFNLNFSKN